MPISIHINRLGCYSLHRLQAEQVRNCG